MNFTKKSATFLAGCIFSWGGLYADSNPLRNTTNPFIKRVVNNSTDETASIAGVAEFVDVWSPDRNIAVDTFSGANTELTNGVEIPLLVEPVTQSQTIPLNFYNQAVGINTKKGTFFLVYGAAPKKSQKYIWVYESNLLDPRKLVKKPYTIPGSQETGPLAIFIDNDGNLQKFESLSSVSYEIDENW